MSSQHSGGDMIDASAYSVDELREAVFEGRGRVARPLALALLSRKNYPGKVADFQKILLDEDEQPRLRAIAASGLGEVQTPASLRALERGLDSRRERDAPRRDESSGQRGRQEARRDVGEART